MSSEGRMLRDRVLEVLKEVLDPELGLNVVELGLVYRAHVTDAGAVEVDLTMTTPACPLGEHILRDAETRIRQLEGVSAVEVKLVWEPPWTPDLMSAAAKKKLGW